MEQKMTLQDTLDMLKKRKTHLDKIIDELIYEAKVKKTSNNKLGALFCLKRKKLYESEVEKVNDHCRTLELQITTQQFEKCKKNEIAHEKIVFNIFSNKIKKQKKQKLKNKN